MLFKRNLIGADAPVGIRTGTLNVQGKVTAGEFQKIYQTTLAAAATSVTISGLDGNTDVLYEVRARVITGAGGGGNEQVRPNNDAVDGNYGYQTLTGTNTTVGAARSTLTGMIFADGNSAGDVSFATMLLYAKSGYVRTSITQATNRIAATTVTNIKLIGNSWNNTADNITSIVIPTAAANGLGIGTVIELWALRKKV